MDKTVKKESTFAEIGDVVQYKLLKEFMEARMDVNEYRILSKGLNNLFHSLHVDHITFDSSGSDKVQPSLTAVRGYKQAKELTGGFINEMA